LLDKRKIKLVRDLIYSQVLASRGRADGILFYCQETWRSKHLFAYPQDNPGPEYFGNLVVLVLYVEENINMMLFQMYLFVTEELYHSSLIDQFRYIKIQHKTIDLSTRLWGINTEFAGFIHQSLVLRPIVLS